MRTVTFNAVSICLVWTDLLHTRHIYSATEKHRANAEILTVSGWALNFELSNFRNRVFLVHIFRFKGTQCSLKVSDLSIIIELDIWGEGVFYLYSFPCDIQFSSRLSDFQGKHAYLSYRWIGFSLHTFVICYHDFNWRLQLIFYFFDIIILNRYRCIIGVNEMSGTWSDQLIVYMLKRNGARTLSCSSHFVAFSFYSSCFTRVT